MLSELINRKKYLLEKEELSASFRNIKRVYKILCAYEKIKPAKIYLSVGLPETVNGRFIVEVKKIFHVPIRIKRKIYIKPDKYWMLYLFHEFTHQVLFSDIGYTGHGRKFNDLEEYFIKKYFDKIYHSLISYQNEQNKGI